MLVRYTLSALLLSACYAISAPVPKRPPPPPPTTLTEKTLVGTWDYAWGPYPSGGITFAADRTYSAVHDYTSSVSYNGTWTLEDNVVTITEYGYNAAGGSVWGPQIYHFDFGETKSPNPSGLSNGTTVVSLSRR